MPEPATSARNGGEIAERGELLEEVARQKEEILRLRDLLIAKDAELGTAKGQLAELTEHSARLTVVARQLQARVPRILWSVRDALLGLLRSRRS